MSGSGIRASDLIRPARDVSWGRISDFEFRHWPGRLGRCLALPVGDADLTKCV